MKKDALPARSRARDEGLGGADALMTVSEVAAQLRVCERTVRRLLSRRELAGLRIGRSVRVKASELAAYLRSGSLR